MSDENNKINSNFFLKGTIIAVIITMISLSAFFVGWYILDDLFNAIIIGVISHLAAMGFSFKISKKIFPTKKSENQH